jgi:hypothetical protein
MTKKILLAAASAAVISFAGAATAADLSVVIAPSATLPASPYVIDASDDEAELYTIATEVDGELSGEVEFTVTYDDLLPTANNLVITFTLGGGATFDSAVTSADLSGFNEVTLSSGGAAGSNTVSFLVSDNVPVGDPAVSSVTLATDIAFDAGDAPSIQVNTRTENGTPIEGGNVMSSAFTFVDYDSFVSVDTSPASDAVLQSETNFTTFAGGFTTATLGTFTVALDSDVYTDFNLSTADADSFDGAELTLDGSLSDLDISVDNGAEVDGNVISIADAGTYTVTATIEEDGTPNSSDYSLTADIDLSTDFNDLDNVEVGELASIVREGTSVVVPWVASGSLGAINSSRNVLRISNSGEATGQVYLEVISASAAQGAAPVFEDGVIATGLTVPANGDLQITSAQMEGFLGDFRRADIRVTVEADSDDLIFRSRVVQPDATFEEITLEAESND